MEDHGRECRVTDVGLVIEPARLGQHVAVGGHIRIGVRDHHRLGARRGTGREQHLPHVVAVDGDIGLGGAVPGDEVLETRCHARRAGSDRHHGFDAGRPELVAEPLPQHLIDDRCPGVDMGQRVEDDVRCHHDVDRRGHQAGLGDRYLGQPRFVGVVAEHRDARCRRQVEREQRVRELVDQRVGLGIGQALMGRIDRGIRGTDQRQLVGFAPGHAFDDVAHRHPVPTIVIATITKIFNIDGHCLAPQFRRSAPHCHHRSRWRQLPGGILGAFRRIPIRASLPAGPFAPL